jgi:hypothetical protein
MHTEIRLLLALLSVFSVSAQANWYLDNESSRLSFTTTHNADVAEVHRFLTLHGKVDRAGLAELEVELESVSTGVAQRDERIREQLFDVGRFPRAKINARLDLQPINDLAPGAQLELRLPLEVQLHGKTHRYGAQLLATRLDERRFQVVTLEPLVLDVRDFGLAPGFATMRSAAGLGAVSLSVPVGAVLIFAAR